MVDSGPGRLAGLAAAPGSSDGALVHAPGRKWENALPVGNGRLGAMVFGRADEEIIQLNEDTYWSGGPYSTTVAGGYAALPEIRRLLFDGQLVQAHRLFGRHLMDTRSSSRNTSRWETSC